MSVGFIVRDEYYSVGSGDFLYSFFSTIAYNLENGDWGSKYPYIMNELYRGELEVESAKECLAELEIIRNELKKYLPDKVVWDIDDLSKRPPWGDNISADITDLSNYFVTNEGEDFIEVLKEALEKTLELKEKLLIEAM